MSKIIGGSISSFFSSYSQIIMIVFFLFIFVLIGVYLYKKYATPKFNQNFTDVANDNQMKGIVPTVDMYFFSADWCPHCTKAKPEWQSFYDDFHETIVNNYKIMCHSVDCTENGKDDPLVLELMQKYDVKSFPTLKVRMDDNTIDFDSKITSSSLDKFVKSVLSNN